MAERASLIEDAARELSAGLRVFTERNLFHAVVRRARALGAPAPDDFEAFRRDWLARRLRTGALPGLLKPRPVRRRPRRFPAEWRSYFPAAILLVDRPALVDLVAASGLLVQARIAAVCLDGTPSDVVRWLCAGIRAGHEAPVGFLHDAATVVYPFSFEPLRTMVALGKQPLVSRDLGLPPGGLPASSLPFQPEGHLEPIRELEEAPPASLLTYATSRLLALLPPDPMLTPLQAPEEAA